MAKNFSFTDDAKRYLLFKIGNELYGTPILSIREVVEPGSVKPVPCAKPFFLGVINIRGEIVSVIDLRIRLGLTADSNSENALIVFDTGSGAIAVKVDSVFSVAELDAKALENNPAVHSRFTASSLIGVAHIGNQLATLVDLSIALAGEDFIFNKKHGRLEMQP